MSNYAQYALELVFMANLLNAVTAAAFNVCDMDPTVCVTVGEISV